MRFSFIYSRVILVGLEPKLKQPNKFSCRFPILNLIETSCVVFEIKYADGQTGLSNIPIHLLYALSSKTSMILTPYSQSSSR